MIHSVLMIGQSNMAGRGNIGDVEPIRNLHLLVLRNGRWQPFFVPVNPDRPFSGISLATGHFTAFAMSRVKPARKPISETICASDRRVLVSYRLWISAWFFGAIRAKDSAGTPLSAKGVESLE